MSHVFCTVVSRLRVFQALALFLSLEQVGAPQKCFILCVDEKTLQLFKRMRLKRVTLLTPRDLYCREWESLQRLRVLNEYCWTLKPLLIETLFYQHEEIDRVTYMDADLFFYHDPRVIFEHQPEGAVLLTRGQIASPLISRPAAEAFQSLMGQYNSGFISFKRDQSGLACLTWWKKRCIECCLSQPKGGRFGDQRYLDEMPYLFGQVEEVRTFGVNIGHWNCDNHTFSIHDGHLYIDGYPLICYHFSGFRIITKDRIVQVHEGGRSRRPFFYRDYSDILRVVIGMVEKLDPSFNGYANCEDTFVQHQSDNSCRKGLLI